MALAPRLFGLRTPEAADCGLFGSLIQEGLCQIIYESDGSLLSNFQFTVSYKRTDTDSSSILSGRGYRFTRHRSAWKFKCLCDVWTTSADDCDLTTWGVYLYSG